MTTPFKMETKYNTRSPAVKRLMREAIELREPTSLYFAQPLEDNLFEWHFTIRGPPGSDYQGGIYHGRITLPHEYPMKPPSIIILTPNGRFEIGHKICLSASSHHPELWQASWGIRTILLALIGFMPTDGLGTIGSIVCESQERKRLAKRSLSWSCSVCGLCENILLSETASDSNSSIDEEVTEEMKQIVSNMTIKSEAEIEEQMKKKHDTVSSNDVTSDGPRQRNPTVTTPTTQTSATPTTQTSATPTEQLHVTLPTGTTPTIQQTIATPTNTVSLLVIFILITFIVLLLARRMLIT